MIGSGQRCLSVFITWMGNKVKGIEIISRGYTEGVGKNPQLRGSHSMTVTLLFLLIGYICVGSFYFYGNCSMYPNNKDNMCWDKWRVQEDDPFESIP